LSVRPSFFSGVSPSFHIAAIVVIIIPDLRTPARAPAPPRREHEAAASNDGGKRKKDRPGHLTSNNF
jgi:hypothetical protein